MRAYVVTERCFAAELLSRLLPPEVMEQVHVEPVGERSSAIAVSHSLLSARKKPVVLVLDAETTNRRLIDEQRVIVEDLLRVTRPDIPISLVLVEPEMEVVLFSDLDGLARSLDVALTVEEELTGRFQPRTVLDGLIARSSRVGCAEALVRSIDEEYARELRLHPVFREIEDFLSREAQIEEVAHA